MRAPAFWQRGSVGAQALLLQPLDDFPAPPAHAAQRRVAARLRPAAGALPALAQQVERQAALGAQQRLPKVEMQQRRHIIWHGLIATRPPAAAGTTTAAAAITRAAGAAGVVVQPPLPVVRENLEGAGDGLQGCTGGGGWVDGQSATLCWRRERRHQQLTGDGTTNAP